MVLQQKLSGTILLIVSSNFIILSLTIWEYGTAAKAAVLITYSKLKFYCSLGNNL